MKKALILILSVIACCIFFGCEKECKHTFADATCIEAKTCTKCGETVGEALGHSWNDATCTEAKTCSNCGETEGKKLGHNYEGQTCTTEGTCTACGDTVAAMGHQWKSPTCAEAAKCSRCEETHGEPLGHDWNDATCTTPKTCKTCKETSGEALGHDWQNATCTKAETCSRCFQTQGSSLGHSWNDATCSDPKTCSTCKETQGNALGHIWSEATCTDAKTCSRCNKTDGKALGHKYSAATCTEPQKCSVCDKVSGSALGHDWKKATCTEPKTCKRCSETSGYSGSHDWKSATCTKPRTCKNCGETEGQAKGHTEVVDRGVEATCTQKGLTEGKHCSECSVILVPQITVQPNGKHSGQNKCSSCNTSFWDLIKELLREYGTYRYDGYEIYSNSSNTIVISYSEKEYSSPYHNYSFTLEISKNSSYISWKFVDTYEDMGYYNGVYISLGTLSYEMSGNTSYSNITKNISSLGYSYNTFPRAKTETAHSRAIVHLERSMAALNKFITTYANGGFSLYNLGFSNY